MKPRDDLHRLIHSLTQAELRYFKVHAARNQRSDDNQTLKLFDAIAAQPQYDEAALRTALAGAPLLRQLTVAKTYLEELLLRVLGEYQFAQGGAANLRRIITQLEILFAKGLFENAKRKAEKGFQQALGQDQLAYALELLRWRIKLLKKTGNRGDFQELLGLQVQEENLLLEMDEESQLRRTHDQLFAILSHGLEGPDRNADAVIQAVLNRPVLSKDPNGLRFNSRLIFHYIHVYAQQYRGNPEGIRHHYAAMARLWEQHPQRQKEEAGRYVVTLMSYLEASYHDLPQAAFYETLDKIRQIKLPDPALAAKAFHQACHLELVYAINTGTSPKSPDLEQAILKGLDEYGGLIDPGARIAFYCNLAILYFLQADFHRSLKWVNLIYNAKIPLLRKDIAAFATSLRLILQYELGDLDLLGYLLQATRRNLQRREEPHPIQQAVVRQLHSLLQNPENPNLPQWNTFAADLEALVALHHDMLAGIKALQVWTTHKMTGNTMQSIVSTGR